MSKFSFTSPDGQLFEIIGPPNATEEQARAIFDQQIKTGGLVGLRSGDTVSAATQAEAGLRSALSQVGIRIPSSVDQAFAALRNVQLTNPITSADFIKQATPNFSLGPLTPSNLQALMAQSAAQADQALNQVSASNGIGKFGVTLPKLEAAGFVKPGTSADYEKSPPPSVTPGDIAEADRIRSEGGDITAEEVSRNRRLNSFLTPSVFTGKDGVSSLQTVLRDENVQNIIEQTGLKQNYDLLVRTGTTLELAAERVGGLLQTASKFDPKTAVDWAKGLEVKNIGEVNLTAKAGEYATSLVNKYGSGIQTQAANLGALTTQIGSVGSVSDLAKLATPLSTNLSGLANEIGQLGSLASQLGVLGGLGGQLGSIGSTVATAAGIVSTVGTVATQLGALPAIASQINNATTFSGLASGISSGIGIVTGVVGLVSGLFGGRGGSIYRGTSRPQGSVNTVNRVTLDSSMQAILGNPKIPTPVFSSQSNQVLGGLNVLKALSGVANMQLRLTGQSALGATVSNNTQQDVRLTYTGNDSIVWDRINLDRLRLGLPGLDAIGLPRPA